MDDKIKYITYQGFEWVDTEDIKKYNRFESTSQHSQRCRSICQPREGRNWRKHHHLLFMTEISSHETLINHVCNQTFCFFFRDFNPWNRKGSMEHWYWNPSSFSCSYPPTERGMRERLLVISDRFQWYPGGKEWLTHVGTSLGDRVPVLSQEKATNLAGVSVVPIFQAPRRILEHRLSG